MLVLSRRLNEKLLIPSIRTAVQVLSIQGTQVRLGVDAPPEVAIFREEIYKGDLQHDNPAGEPRGDVLPARLRAALRTRLAGLALGLDRVHEQLDGKAGPGVQAALDKLGDEFDDLARLVALLLKEDDAPAGQRAVGCFP
jgi:carbon storage regulator CsrA